jgi:hypothetical protein
MTGNIPDDVADAAFELGSVVLEAIEEDGRDPEKHQVPLIAHLFAAARREGWTGSPAEQVASFAVGGCEPAELERAKRAAPEGAVAWRKLKRYAPDEAIVLRRLLCQHSPGGIDRQPKELELNRAPEPPRWIVEGLIERGSTHLISGDTGAGKSIWIASMVAAALRQTDFLGRRRGGRTISGRRRREQ